MSCKRFLADRSAFVRSPGNATRGITTRAEREEEEEDCDAEVTLGLSERHDSLSRFHLGPIFSLGSAR